ncbi:MAG TPA: hypothetical protein VJB66_05145 [Candidatus Nanoarchaeia archaeon]|nr:hypothetical protein [Candidatus Nanoarchaeia archaeon]
MSKEGEDFVKKMLDSIKNNEVTLPQEQFGSVTDEAVQDALKEILRGNTIRKR